MNEAARTEQTEKFLENLKGVFFYSTPHRGAAIARYQKYLPPCLKTFRSPVLKDLLPLTAEGSRLNARLRTNDGNIQFQMFGPDRNGANESVGTRVSDGGDGGSGPNLP